MLFREKSLKKSQVAFKGIDKGKGLDKRKKEWSHREGRPVNHSYCRHPGGTNGRIRGGTNKLQTKSAYQPHREREDVFTL